MSTDVEKSPVKMTYWFHCLMFLVLIVGIGFLPTFGQITPLGMDILGVFVGLIYGWIFIGFIWPSLFGLVALGFTEYMPNATAAVAGGFGESLVWQVFFMMVFADLLRRLGVTEFVSYWFLSRKLCVGRPWVLTGMLFVIAFTCGGIVTLYATIFMLWAIVYDLCKIGGYKKGDPWVGFTLGGIVFFTAISPVIFPFKPFPLMIMGLVKHTGITELPFVPWLVLGLIMIFSLLFLYLLVGRFIFKIDVSGLSTDEDLYGKYRGMKMNGDQRLGMIFLGALIVLLTIPSILPIAWPVVAFIKKADLLGSAIVLLCLALLVRRKDGSGLANFKDLTQAVSWDIIIMFAVTLPVSTAMEAKETGLVATAMEYLMPIFNQVSPIVFAGLAIFIFGLLTQVAHNLIIMLIFTPVLGTLCAEYGINPLLFAFTFVTMLQCAFATPAASAQGALVFTNTEWITGKQAYTYGATFVLLGLLVTIFVMMPLGALLF